MPRMLAFELLHAEGLARRGRLTLNHGVVDTPQFMPVGTYGSVKGVLPQALVQMGAQIILGNTFHLWLRPGVDVIRAFDGLHRFEGWSHSILTDSGGFQVWSLGAMRTISEEGVRFASPVNGDRMFLTPEVSMQIQTVLNSDIVMQFDECTPYASGGRVTTEDDARASMALSLRWARRCVDEFQRLENPNALFGIVQGGMFESLREESLARLAERHRFAAVLPGHGARHLGDGDDLHDRRARVLEALDDRCHLRGQPIDREPAVMRLQPLLQRRLPVLGEGRFVGAIAGGGDERTEQRDDEVARILDAAIEINRRDECFEAVGEDGVLLAATRLLFAAPQQHESSQLDVVGEARE